jgi:hypothetical protein
MRAVKQIVLALFALGLLACASPGAAEETAAGPPDWWASHVDFMSRDGGAWITPNPDAANDPAAPAEAVCGAAARLTPAAKRCISRYGAEHRDIRPRNGSPRRSA